MPEKPNILMLFTDQQRFDALGCVVARMTMVAGHRVARE
jgi:hypothetical protein